MLDEGLLFAKKVVAPVQFAPQENFQSKQYRVDVKSLFLETDPLMQLNIERGEPSL